MNENESSRKSVDNLPNLGLKVPEILDAVEKLRQVTVDCVNELVKTDNYDAFEQALIIMFKSFGISETTNPELSARNHSLWKQKYDFYHYMTSDPSYTGDVFLDIEMVGEGAYVNLNFVSKSVRTLYGRERMVKVCPGACSLPNPVAPGASHWHLPERNFYKMAEVVLGVDIDIKTNEDWPTNPHTITKLNEMYSFFVVNGKYKRVKAKNAWQNIKNLVSSLPKLK